MIETKFHDDILEIVMDNPPVNALGAVLPQALSAAVMDARPDPYQGDRDQRRRKIALGNFTLSPLLVRCAAEGASLGTCRVGKCRASITI